jgi:hypothetical protein
MVSKHGRGRWRKSAAEGPVSLLAPLLPRRLAAALLSARCAAATLALVAAADVALALALFAELHGWRFQRGAQRLPRRRAARGEALTRSRRRSPRRRLLGGALGVVPRLFRRR